MMVKSSICLGFGEKGGEEDKGRIERIWDLNLISRLRQPNPKI